jgi:hypothetical protein
MLDLDHLTLYAGAHDPGDKMCVMEAVAYVAGEPWSDHPECASEVIGEFLRAWNDGLPDEDRQMLRPLIPRLVGTRASSAVELRRSWMACDWLVRRNAPAWLRLAGLLDAAAALEGLPEIRSAGMLDVAWPVIREAQEQAAAASAAAWDVAWAAAAAGARAAAAAGARAAAWAAGAAGARAAAWAAAAASDAAGDAAGAAAGAAARVALADTVAELQSSALGLVDRMIECRDEREQRRRES